MPTIYRVECDRQFGPFIRYGWMYSDPLRYAVLPAPWEDNLMSNDEVYGSMRCGCESKEQLHRWFPPEQAEELTLAGLLVSIYEVPAYRAGSAQVLFDASQATLLRRVPLQEV